MHLDMSVYDSRDLYVSILQPNTVKEKVALFWRIAYPGVLVEVKSHHYSLCSSVAHLILEGAQGTNPCLGRYSCEEIYRSSTLVYNQNM